MITPTIGNRQRIQRTRTLRRREKFHRARIETERKFTRARKLPPSASLVKVHITTSNYKVIRVQQLFIYPTNWCVCGTYIWRRHVNIDAPIFHPFIYQRIDTIAAVDGFLESRCYGNCYDSDHPISSIPRDFFFIPDCHQLPNR